MGENRVVATVFHHFWGSEKNFLNNIKNLENLAD